MQALTSSWAGVVRSVLAGDTSSSSLLVDDFVWGCHDNPKFWNDSWSTISWDLRRLISSLGLKVHSSYHPSIPSDSTTFLSDIWVMKIHGTKKVKLWANLFALLTDVLIKMTNTGCCSGFLSLDLTVLIPLVTSVLPIQHQNKQINSSPKDTIQNEHGVSAKDISKIIQNVQTNCLKLITAIVNTRNPALLRMASAISEPVLSLALNPALFKSTIRDAWLLCVSAIIPMFPTLFGSDCKQQQASSEATVGLLVSTFHNEVNTFTRSRMTVTNLEAETDSLQSPVTSEESPTPPELLGFDKDYIHYMNLLVNALECLILNSGCIMDTQKRDHIEYALAQSLVCLQQGIQPFQLPNRHMRRSSCEILRSSPALQTLIVQLAQADVLVPQKGNLVCGNIPLIKNVCSVLLQQYATSSVASRLLAVIDATIHPTMLTLPSNNHILTNRHLAGAYPNGTSMYADPSDTLDSQNLPEYFKNGVNGDPNSLENQMEETKRTIKDHSRIDEAVVNIQSISRPIDITSEFSKSEVAPADGDTDSVLKSTGKTQKSGKHTALLPIDPSSYLFPDPKPLVVKSKSMSSQPTQQSSLKRSRRNDSTAYSEHEDDDIDDFELPDIQIDADPDEPNR